MPRCSAAATVAAASLFLASALVLGQQPASGAQSGGLASGPQSGSTVEQALLHKARGRDGEAAAAFTAAAAEICARADATPSERLAVEGCAGAALNLHGRCPADAALPARLLALRASPLLQADAGLRDQIAVLCLDRLTAMGSDEVAALARELGYLDDVWICGPFDNERGAALQRRLPAETQLDRSATFPGKQRPVAWRRLTHRTAAGRLWLGAVLRPAEQSACLVATSLVAARDTTAALHLGTSGSFEVSLSGVKVGARDVDRSFALDQDAVALPLRAGPNLLVVKLCHQENGEFAASLRLSALQGGPLADVVADAGPEAMDRAAEAMTAAAPPEAGAATASPAASPDMGARSRFDVGSVRSMDALWLATLYFLHGADGAADRRDQRLAQRAADDMPDLSQARILLAATRVRIARVAAEIDENARRGDYEALLAMDPQHTEAAVQLGRLLLQGTGLRQLAEDLARRALAVAPDWEPARLLLADALSAADLSSLARRELLSAAALPAASSLCLRQATRAAADGAVQLSTSLHQRLAAGSGELGDRLAHARMLLRQGRRDDALAAVQRILAQEPLARAAWLLRIECNEAASDFTAALQDCAAWLQLCPDDDDMLATVSRLHARLGQRDDQVEALRAALECNPNRRDDQRYLEFLAAEAEPFYAAFQVDAAPLLQVATPAAAAAGRDPVFHLLRQRVVQAHRNGTTSEYLHLCVRILTDAGARGWSSFRLPFQVGEQRARLLAVTVHKADGGREQPRLQGASVALQSLLPGDTVDIEGRIDSLAPTFFGDYFGVVHYFTAPDGCAVQRSEFAVLAEPGRDYRWQVAGGAPEPQQTAAADGTRTFAMRLDDVAREVPEPNRPHARERAPLVRFTTFRDWDHFASWWWNLIRGQIEMTPAMKVHVQQLIADCTTQEQRIAALYHFVTTDVRYEAWEFGVHGYKPYSTAVIHERRHGDCKDKALLLCALLSEISVHAAPVLIFADERRSMDDLSLPMVQHFNHCIAWLPAQDGRPEQFLDGTAIWHPPATLPEMDQGADVLIVDEGKALLRTVPWTTPEQNCDRVRFELELLRAGGARGRQVESPLGNAAVALRSALAVEPARRREHVERSLVALFGPVTLSEIACTEPLRDDEPVRLTVDFEVAALGQRTAAEWQLPSTLGREGLLDLVAEPERRTPLLLGVPHRDERTIAFRLPPGWRAATLPGTAEQRAPFGRFLVEWRAESDQVVVARTVEIGQSRIEPGDYAAFRDFVSALRAADAQRIVLQPTDAR